MHSRAPPPPTKKIMLQQEQKFEVNVTDKEGNLGKWSRNYRLQDSKERKE